MGSAIQFFKPGTHTDMRGREITFTRRDIEEMVAGYDASTRPAPLVIGHPKTDDPAYGWVDRLSVDEQGYAYAVPSQVSDDMRALVDAGAYKYVSASLYTPDSPGNPTPGKYYLRHIGFLGATPPAVKGLRAVQFAADEDGVVEFGTYDDRMHAGLLRRLRNWMIAKFGLEDADEALPEWDVQHLSDVAAQPELPPPNEVTPAFSAPLESPVTEDERAALEAENAQLKAQLDAVKAEATARERAARHAANLAFAQGLSADGKLPADHVATLVATLDLADTDSVQFGEGDDAKPLGEAVRALFAEAKPAVVFGEIAKDPKLPPEDIQFADADPERLAMHDQIRAYMRDHQTDYAAAAHAVLK